LILQPFGGETLDRDSHKLTAGPNARFAEKLLDAGLHGSFGRLKSRRDFFVAKTIENAAKYKPLTIGQLTILYYRARLINCVR
jgi:hypothetical protein